MSFSHDSEIGRGGGNAVWAGKWGALQKKKGGCCNSRPLSTKT